MRAHFTRLVLAAALFAAPVPALAQQTDQARESATQVRQVKPAPNPAPVSSTSAFRRGYVLFNVGYQGATNTFSMTWSYPSNLETAAVTAAYSAKPALLIDGGGGVRVWRGLSLGVGVSRYDRSEAAGVSASVPHPFFYNKPRTYQGTTVGLGRTETAVHIQAMWTAAVARRAQVGVFGGPSYFNVRQVVVSSMNFVDAYPYDSITAANPSTGDQTASKMGFNVGGDFTYLLYRQIGIGAMVRFSGAAVAFKAPGGTAISSNAGGLQAGGGLRVRF